MSVYDTLKRQLKTKPKTWLITGVAGFIGSNLLESLLKLNQRVVGLDNLSTGRLCNLEEVETHVTPEQWANFNFIQGDIRNLDKCRDAMVFNTAPTDTQSLFSNVDFVLHQAALGSVPRSVEDPIITNQNNIDGFLNMLVAARDAKAKRFVFASSSSIYGDHPDLPKVEDKIGKPLSPYAVTKLVNELYADVFSRTYDLKIIGLRYFNVFGCRQSPDGPYAAVIPKWISAMLKNEPIHIYGDGETSRDFCYIENVIQANLLAATAIKEEAINKIYNIALGDQTSLNKLHSYIRDILIIYFPNLKTAQPNHLDFRAGDIRHSHADITRAKRFLGYAPTHLIIDGLAEIMNWYIDRYPRKI